MALHTEDIDLSDLEEVPNDPCIKFEDLPDLDEVLPLKPGEGWDDGTVIPIPVSCDKELNGGFSFKLVCRVWWEREQTEQSTESLQKQDPDSNQKPADSNRNEGSIQKPHAHQTPDSNQNPDSTQQTSNELLGRQIVKEKGWNRDRNDKQRRKPDEFGNLNYPPHRQRCLEDLQGTSDRWFQQQNCGSQRPQWNGRPQMAQDSTPFNRPFFETPMMEAEPPQWWGYPSPQQNRSHGFSIHPDQVNQPFRNDVEGFQDPSTNIHHQYHHHHPEFSQVNYNNARRMSDAGQFYPKKKKNQNWEQQGNGTPVHLWPRPDQHRSLVWMNNSDFQPQRNRSYSPTPRNARRMADEHFRKRNYF